MEIVPNIITFLMQNSTVTALFDHRVTGKDVTDMTYPYAYLWEVSSPQQHTHQGRSGRVALIQCDVVSDTPTGADLAKRTLFDALDSYHGMMGELSVGYCFVNSRDIPKDPEQQSYRNILEIEIATNN